MITRLNTVELIEDACALLYKTHIEQAGWKFEPDNPSLLRIEVKNNRNLLIDRFTDKAIWFGAFDNSRLVSCVRLTFADESNAFEIEGYKNSTVIKEFLPADKSHCVEISRAAVTNSHNGLGIIKQLFSFAFQYCEDNHYSVFGASRHGYILGLFKKISFPLKMEYAFKYEKNDPLAVNFYFADYAKSEIKSMIVNLSTQNSSKIIDALEIVAPVLPALIYWHDTQGTVLGVNGRCLEGMGVAKASDVIGKNLYDFYPKNTAELILAHNEQVIKTGEILSQDEQIADISTGGIKIFRSTKAPLYDDEGKVIGIVGCSIEVTAEKEAERLKIENETKTALLEEQEKFTKIAHQVAHDIRSPLSTLLMIVKSCTHIPEAERIALREAARGIGDIANNLLDKYKKNEEESLKTEESKLLLVPTTLLELLTSIKYRYKKLPINFDWHFEDNTQFTFIKIQFSAFNRMISNLINNAVDALGDTKGTVSLHFATDNEWVKISIRDTGKGMSPELIAKIMDRMAITEGKKEGHGIGLRQVWETLDKNQGKMQIESSLGKGSTITLTFPRMRAPDWIAEEIVLNADDTVIILDDDSSIHGAWQTRFENSLDKQPKIKRKHFKEGKEALAFINTLSPLEKNNLFLLSDYELLRQELNGIDIIIKSEIARSILVTSYHTDPQVQEQAAKADTKILPKQLASEVPIRIVASAPSDKKVSISAKVDMVIVEDDETLLTSLVSLMFDDRIVDQYMRPEDFLKNLHRYSKDTKIYLDNNYHNSWLKGIDIARELHEKGYEHLYLFTGSVFSPGEIPSYLTVIAKEDLDGLERSKHD